MLLAKSLATSLSLALSVGRGPTAVVITFLRGCREVDVNDPLKQPDKLKKVYLPKKDFDCRLLDL